MGMMKALMGEETEVMDAGEMKSNFQMDLELIASVMKENKLTAFIFVMRTTPEIESIPIVEVVGTEGKALFAAKRAKCDTLGDVVNKWDVLTGVKGNGQSAAKLVHRAVIEWYYDRLNVKQKKQFWRESLKATGIDDFEFLEG